jgi:nicotinate-nucleotide--dimethylbenzimidazole phosphoribosyltransferase
MNLTDIESVDDQYFKIAQDRWDNLIKPQGSLGVLEEIVSRICAIKRTVTPSVDRKRLLVFAADHGIVEAGVSAYPQKVTTQMVRGFLSGHAAISVLAKNFSIDLKIVDMGIASHFSHADLYKIHINDGTRNFLNEPAMTFDEMNAAMEAGIRFAREAKADGIEILAGGDMGIGNTTSASAIYAALFNVNPDQVTGKGAGLDEPGRLRKSEVIRAAIEKWKIGQNEPLKILQHFGGFEIAALTGFYLGAASERIPIVIDGFICTAAAALAISLCFNAKNYMFFSHCSAENGYVWIQNRMDFRPILDLRMRLGEGTGAALAMMIVDSAVKLFREMPTFDQAEVSRKKE